MSEKVLKRLSKKERFQYNNLDKVLSYYVSGQFEKFLTYNGATSIDFYADIKNKRSSLLVDFYYYNFRIGMNFDEKGYVIHQTYYNETSISRKDVTEEEYSLGFSILIVLENLIDKLNSDPGLDKDIVQINNPQPTRHRTTRSLKLAPLLVAIPFIFVFVFMMILISYPGHLEIEFVHILGSFITFGFIGVVALFMIIAIVSARRRK